MLTRYLPANFTKFDDCMSLWISISGYDDISIFNKILVYDSGMREDL